MLREEVWKEVNEGKEKPRYNCCIEWKVNVVKETESSQQHCRSKVEKLAASLDRLIWAISHCLIEELCLHIFLCDITISLFGSWFGMEGCYLSNIVNVLWISLGVVQGTPDVAPSAFPASADDYPYDPGNPFWYLIRWQTIELLWQINSPLICPFWLPQTPSIKLTWS